MSGRPVSILAVWLLRVGIRAVRMLPYRAGCTLAQAGGFACFFVARKQRRLALANLRLAYGDEKSFSEMNRIAMRSFINMGLNVVDFCQARWLAGRDLHRFVQVEGLEHVEGALSEGKGVILLTAHLGSWELMAAAGAAVGIPLTAIVSSTGDPLIDQFMKTTRELCGYEVLPKRKIRYGVISRLKRNAAVGILADQSPRRDGILVDFFGQQAGATRGPAVFALRSGASVIPGFGIRLGDCTKHKLVFEKPLDLVHTGDMETDILRNTELFQQVIERYVRRYPDQWLWMQKRWKIRSALKRKLEEADEQESATPRRNPE
jgi:KDO2-lipid IV(A) lauroyltransferase